MPGHHSSDEGERWASSSEAGSDDENLVSARGRGEQLAAILEHQRQVLEQDPTELRRRRASNRQEVDEEVDARTRERLYTLSSIVPGGPPMARQRLLRLLNQFIDAHKGPKGIARGKLEGFERRKKGLLKRLCDFLLLKVDRSKKRDAITGEVLIDPKTGKPVRMFIKSLLSLRAEVARLIRLCPYPPLTLKEEIDMRRGLVTYSKGLIDYFGLKHSRRKRQILFAEDIRHMIEHVLRDGSKPHDIAIQQCALMCLFLYTGAREGSVLSTTHYPEKYLRWKDVTFVPSRKDGIIIGFQVIINLVSFKAYNDTSDLTIEFKIKPTKSARLAILDLGQFLFAMAFRRGAFGDHTLDELLSTNDQSLVVKEDMLEDPVFLSKHSRTSLSEDGPLSGRKASDALKDVLRAVGLATGIPGSDTYYCTRRAFATRGIRVMGRELTRFYLGHDASSSMLERSYDRTSDMVNQTAVWEPGEQDLFIDTPRVYQRSTDIQQVTQMTMKEACEQSPEWCHLRQKVSFLKQCLDTGSTYWLTVEPYRTLNQATPLTQAELPTLLAADIYQMKQIKEALKRNEWKTEIERQQLQQNRADEAVIRRRQELGEQPSDVIKQLAKRLLEQERLALETYVPGADGYRVSFEPELEGDDDAVDDDEFDADDLDEDDMSGEGDAEEQADIADPELALLETTEHESGVEDGTETQGEEGEAMRGYSEEEALESMVAVENRVQEGDDELQPPDQVDTHGDAQEQETNPENSVSIFKWDPTLDKRQLLRALTTLDLIDGSAEAVGSNMAASPTKDPRYCQLCLADSTASQADKERIWPILQKSRKLRHDIIFHSAWPRSRRWLATMYQKIDGRLRYVCPFETIDEEGTKAVCGHRLIVDKPSGDMAPQLIIKAQKHLVEHHPRAIPADLYEAIDPATAAISRKRVADRKAMEMAPESARRTLDAKGDQKIRARQLDRVMNDFVVDSDQDANWGLGRSAWEEGIIDFHTDLIPPCLLDNDGKLKLDGYVV